MFDKKHFYFLFFIFLGFFSMPFFTLAQSSTLPTVSINPKTQTSPSGQKAMVKITSTNATKCTISGGNFNKNNLSNLNGNISLFPTVTTTYTFECKNEAGLTASTTTLINVTPIPTTTTINTSTTNIGNQTQTNTQTNSTGSQTSPKTQSPGPTSAQQQASQYSTQTIAVKANELCARYSAYNNVYTSPRVGSGNVVPTSLPTLEEIMKSIERYTALGANELRQQNLLKYCEEYQNMARASQRLSEQTVKELKNLADNCYADERCMSKRVYDSDVENELKYYQSYPTFGTEIANLIKTIIVQKEVKDDTPNKQDVDQCVQLRAQGRNTPFCQLVPTKEEVIRQEFYAARDRIEKGQIKIASAFDKGVMGSRPCVETADGKDPSEVKFYEPNCIKYRQEPLLINQEVLRQITSLPYTQAFSPSSILGADGVLGNITDRVRNGNLVDTDISPNFGSASNNNTGGGSGGGNGGGTGVTATDLKSVEANYKQLLTNISAIENLYEVGKIAYSSSTAVCKILPVTTRAVVITQLSASKKVYTDYKNTLQQLWISANTTSKEDHTNLIVKINFDLKDKFNQPAIEKVLDQVKGLIQSCVDAGGKTS